ncbi:Hint domain-containing protein [uncultured Litoreibacter sp.]|uniref:Hint domain-containing protein n=1 Tax=uncultured Litoreibacter sp. TaxID=1392394 RepID=UPI00261C1176|nr:Hint domain-containing protein [uncultured Litoreibacter sp.]
MFFKSKAKAAKAAAPLVLNVAPAPGFFAGTEVATRYAWTKVEDLKVGDTVLTAQNGEQDIVRIETGELNVSAHAAAAGQWPLLVPEGALGNEKAMMVSPGMRVVIEDDAAEALFGQSCVAVQAEALIGYNGIARARVSGPMAHVTLVFADPQCVVAGGGLFFDLPDARGVSNFLPLDERQSRQLVSRMSNAERKQRGPTPKAAWI